MPSRRHTARRPGDLLGPPCLIMRNESKPSALVSTSLPCATPSRLGSQGSLKEISLPVGA